MIAFSCMAKQDISYRRLRTEVARYRNYLYKSGVCRNDNIGLLIRNSPDFVYAYLAIVSLGAVVVPINYQLAAQEIAFIVKDAKIKDLLIAKKLDLTNPLNDFGYFAEVAQHVIDQINRFPIASEAGSAMGYGD